MIEDEDTPDEGGLEPASDEVEAEAPDVEEAPEPERYTIDEFAEAFGPRWERFATHGGLESVRQAGSAYENATGLIRQGAHLEPQSPDVYEKIGLDPNEVQIPEPDPGPGIFGAPWEAPTTWDEIHALSQSEHLEHRVMAADAVVRSPDAPENYKEYYWDQAYGTGTYKQAVLQQQWMEERLAAREAEMDARFAERYAPLEQSHTNTWVDGMLAQARASIPGFTDHESGIARVMEEREQKFPGYQKNFENSDIQTQLAEFQELTLIAASRATPAQQAAAQAAADATDAAKQRARTETSRTNGQPDTEQSELKRQSIAEAQRVFGQVR